MAALEGIGLVSYNGVVFDGPMISSQVSIENVRGDDDRAVLYSNVSVQIKATVSINQCGVSQADLAGTSYLAMMDKIRFMLSQDGKALAFEDKIFRRFHVNTGGGQYYDLIDVNYGPRVKVGSIVPIVSNRAFEVTWTVVAAVGQCPELVGGLLTGGFVRTWAEGDIKQVVYAVEWSSDHRGYTNRTVSGFIEIVSTPAMHNDTVLVTAEDYRDRLAIHMPKAFRRTRDTWKLNEKRDRINFQVTDEESDSPNPYPPGVVDIEVTHEVSIGASSGWTKGMSVISGFCEVANPLPASEAWEKLYPIIDTRITAARLAYGGILLTNVRVKESLFSRRVEFNISFYKLSSSPYGFLKSSGMFTPTDAADTWDAWRKTMFGIDEENNDEEYQRVLANGGRQTTRLPWARRSIANLSYEPSDDIIVTPCTAQPFDVTVHNQRIDPFPNDLQSALRNTCPAANKSYVRYRNKIKMGLRSSIPSFSEMPVVSTAYAPSRPATTDGTQGPSSRHPTEKKNRYSFSGEDFRIVIFGEAMRVGYPPELPQINQDFLDSVDPTTTQFEMLPRDDQCMHTSKKMLGCTVYGSRWMIEYAVNKSVAAMAADLDDLKKKLFITPVLPGGDIEDDEV